MSSLTRSTRPTLPFLPFGLFSSAIIASGSLVKLFHKPAGRRRYFAPPALDSGQECSGIVEMGGLAFRPLIEPRSIDDDLAVGSEFDLSAVHRTRRRALKVDPFAVIPAAVARTFEFVLARLPIRSAAQMRAARVNHEDSVGRSIDPDAIFLLEFSVNPEREFRGIADLKN